MPRRPAAVRWSPAVAQEREAGPGVGDDVRVDLRHQRGLDLGGLHEHVPEGVDDHGVPGVRQRPAITAAPVPHPVHADDVGLVLDGPRLQQRGPVASTGPRPVGRHEVAVGVLGELPELVGEPEVEAHEQAAPHAADLDGDELVTGGEVLVLTRVGERVHLRVPVHGAVGPGEHERVVGAGFALAAFGQAAPDPGARLGGLVDEELRRRSVDGFARAVGVHGEPAREHLRQQHQVGAAGCRGRDAGRQAAVVGGRVLPGQVGLDPGDGQRHVSPSGAVPAGGAAPRRAARRSCRRRIAPAGGPRRRRRGRPPRGWPPPRPPSAAAGRTPCRPPRRGHARRP